MLNKSIFGLGLGLSLLLSACGGPESDFRKLGRLACEGKSEILRLSQKYPNAQTDDKQRESLLKESEAWQKKAKAFQESLATKYQQQLNADQAFAKQMFGYVAEEMKKCGIDAPTDNIGENSSSSSSSSEQGIDDAIRILEALKSDNEEAFPMPKPEAPTPNEPEMPEMENTVTNTSSSKQVTTTTRTESVTINGKTTSKTTTTSTTVTGN